MMETIKPEDQFLKDKNIVPSISFKDMTAHTVKIMKRKLETIKDPASGNDITGVAYLVEENGEQKRFFTASVKLVQLLKDIDENEEVAIKMKSVKGADGFRSTFVVDKVAGNADSEPMPEPDGETATKENDAVEEVDLDDLPF